MQSEILFVVDNHVTSLEISTNQNFFPARKLFTLVISCLRRANIVAIWLPVSTAVGIACLTMYRMIGRFSPFCSSYPLAHLSSPPRPNFSHLTDDPYITLASLRFCFPPSFPFLSLLIVDFSLAFGVSFL